MSEDSEIIEVKDKSLEEWLEMVFNPPSEKMFVRIAFPTDKHREEYLKGIDKRTEEEVKKLLFVFLVKSQSFPSDKLQLLSLKAAVKSKPELSKKMLENQYFRRLVLFGLRKSANPPWEGITWILDLLPHYPKTALEGLNAYITAHIQLLPDWQLHGLFDAMEIIRAKFIGFPDTKNKAIKFLYTLSSRQFECLVERLYKEKGYETKLTPPQKDGGFDVTAKKKIVSNAEYLLIECKNYKTQPVSVEIVRALSGVVFQKKANKGVVVTGNRFTKDAIKTAEENLIELIGGAELIPLLNEHLGPNWALHIDRYVIEAETGRKK